MQQRAFWLDLVCVAWSVVAVLKCSCNFWEIVVGCRLGGIHWLIRRRVHTWNFEVDMVTCLRIKARSTAASRLNLLIWK